LGVKTSLRAHNQSLKCGNGIGRREHIVYKLHGLAHARLGPNVKDIPAERAKQWLDGVESVPISGRHDG